jgi:hypothetical protein
MGGKAGSSSGNNARKGENAMKNIDVQIHGLDVDIGLAQKVTRVLAEQTNPDTDLVSWFDKTEDRYSPWVPKECACDSEDHAYWERYGMNRGGRLKMIVNEGEFELIYT